MFVLSCSVVALSYIAFAFVLLDFRELPCSSVCVFLHVSMFLCFPWLTFSTCLCAKSCLMCCSLDSILMLCEWKESLGVVFPGANLTWYVFTLSSASSLIWLWHKQPALVFLCVKSDDRVSILLVHCKQMIKDKDGVCIWQTMSCSDTLFFLYATWPCW